MLLAVLAINSLLVVAAVLVHYELLYQMAHLTPHLHIPHRYRVLTGVLAVIVAHVVEIWLFAGGYFLMHAVGNMGDLHGFGAEVTLLECSYFSFTTFTTLGYGDAYATGWLRSTTGLEALTGFVLITWSASFLFLEMQKYWPNLGGGRSRR